MHNHKRDFFDKIDGPLSALACNCLQLSCLFPQRDNFCIYNGTADTANWMGVYVDSGGGTNIPLRDMVIPGTHDSASMTIQPYKLFSAAGRTQNVSVTAQLEAGARYLDVRVASSSKDNSLISIWHGCLEGGHVEDVLHEISDFMQTHPKEVVILELVPEYGKKFNKEQKLKCLEMAYEILPKSCILPESDLRETITTKPFAELAGQSQRLIVLMHDRFYEKDDGIDMTPNEISEKYGFAKSGQYFRSPWNDTRDKKILLEKNLETIEKFSEYKGRLLCNQFLATPGVSGVSDVINALTGLNSLRPVSHACQLYKHGILDVFLRQNSNKSWNIISLDFIDLCPEIIELLISFNWYQHITMKINKAIVRIGNTDQDVTDKVIPYICRDCVLFLTDPENDLGLGDDTDFVLTIAYSITNNDGSEVQHYVSTVDIHCDCPFILSPYTSNEGVVKVEITSETGIVKGSNVYASMDEVTDDEIGTPLEFTVDGTNCEFNIAA